jgi:hypothetical protein
MQLVKQLVKPHMQLVKQLVQLVKQLASACIRALAYAP